MHDLGRGGQIKSVSWRSGLKKYIGIGTFDRINGVLDMNGHVWVVGGETMETAEKDRVGGSGSPVEKY